MDLIGFDFISHTNSFAHLATILPNGLPHSTPIWFYYDKFENIFKVSIERDSRKERNLTINPNVCLSIQNPDNPYHYVQIKGIVTKKELDKDNAFSNLLFQKYSENRLLESWFNYSNPLYIVTIKPTHITGWKKESADNFYQNMAKDQ